MFIIWETTENDVFRIKNIDVLYPLGGENQYFDVFCVPWNTWGHCRYATHDKVCIWYDTDRPWNGFLLLSSALFLLNIIY